MKLPPMSYKDYVWPHNPRDCTVSAQRTVALTKLPGGAWHTADLGRHARRIAGSGAFSGDEAYSQYQALYKVFCQEGEGALYHPVIGTLTALFETLSLTQEPSANYVAYSFSFTECGQAALLETAAAQGETAVYHTLSAGETFWTVCALFSLTPSALAALNPGVPSPAKVGSGDVLRVA